MYKYQQIANTIKKKIDNQSYQPNQKLPSIIQLSKTYHCSKATVLKSYELLCNQHLIYTKPQSGYYVANNPILQKQDSQYYYLNTGNPIVSTTSLVDAKHCLSIAIDQYSKSSLNISLQGVESLHQLLPDFLSKYDIYTKTELIYLTQGITQMLSFLTLTNFNDKNGILIEEPTYSYYVQFLKTQNIPVYTILRHEDGIDLHQLELLFQENKIKFFYVVPRNHNPLGTNLNTKTRQRIAKLALKYNVIIIEDDYFSHAFHTPHYLPIHYYMAGQNCVYLTSFSKTIPYLRIGICVIDPAFKPIFETLIHQSYYYSYQLPSLISQATLEAYLQNNLYEQQMLKLERKLKNHFKVIQAITSNWDPNIAKLIGGYAGYYCSIQVHFKLSLDLLEKELEKHHILIARNERCFYNEEHFNHTIRLSITRCNSKKQLENALCLFYQILESLTIKYIHSI